MYTTLNPSMSLTVWLQPRFGLECRWVHAGTITVAKITDISSSFSTRLA